MVGVNIPKAADQSERNADRATRFTVDAQTEVIQGQTVLVTSLVETHFKFCTGDT